MTIASLIKRIVLGIAVLTSMGTVVHDTKIDKAYQLTVPLVSASGGLGSHYDGLNEGTSHTHVERTSFSQQVSALPKIQPRNDHRRYTIPKSSSRSHSFFGMGGLLWPSV